MSADVVEFGEPWPEITGVMRVSTKPHIRRMGCGWVCTGRGCVGQGDSPQSAYGVWQYVVWCWEANSPPLHIRLLVQGGCH